jgi:hypothetical protein
LQSNINKASGFWAGLVCEQDRDPIKGPLFYWSYIFYLSKFYELLDSYLLVLKKVKYMESFLLNMIETSVILACISSYCDALCLLGWLRGKMVHGTLVF